MVSLSEGYIFQVYGSKMQRRLFWTYEGRRWGKAMADYPQELAQDAVCQSRTGHMTGLWFLPTRPLRPNANE